MKLWARMEAFELKLAALIRLTFLEAIRRKIALAAFILGVAFLALYATGVHFIHKDVITKLQGRPAQTLVTNQIYSFLTMAGLYSVNFLSIAMGALVSADTLAGEIASGAIQTIASKPVRRMQIVLGKWIGFAVLLAAYLLLMAGGVLGTMFGWTGYHVKNLLPGLALIYCESVLMMTVSLACSSRFSTLATGGIVFGLYGIGFIGGWVEQIGTALQNDTARNIGIVSSLIIPAESLWKRATYEMSSTLIRSLGAQAGPFSAASVPSTAMLIYAGIYLLAMLLIALRIFSRRDL